MRGPTPATAQQAQRDILGKPNGLPAAAATFEISAHTGSPGEDGNANEATGGGYTRITGLTEADLTDPAGTDPSTFSPVAALDFAISTGAISAGAPLTHFVLRRGDDQTALFLAVAPSPQSVTAAGQFIRVSVSAQFGTALAP